MSFSSFWFDELESLVKEIRVHLDKLEDDPSGFGKTF
jgi:hypothetical protein